MNDDPQLPNTNKDIHIKSFPRKIIFSVLIILAALCIGFIVGYKSHTTGYVDYATATLPISPTLEPTSTPMPLNMVAFPRDQYSSDFVKRQIDPSKKFFYDYTLPSSMTSIPDSELVNMKCSHDISLSQGKFMENYKTDFDSAMQSKVVSNDNFYKSLIFAINRSIASEARVTGFIYCQTEDYPEKRYMNSYVIYSIQSDINRNNINIAITGQDSVSNLASLSAIFETCTPIQLSTSGDLYLLCEGGDTRGHADIYKVNIAEKAQITPIFYCATGEPGVNTPPPKCSTEPQ